MIVEIVKGNGFIGVKITDNGLVYFVIEGEFPNLITNDKLYTWRKVGLLKDFKEYINDNTIKFINGFLFLRHHS